MFLTSTKFLSLFSIALSASLSVSGASVDVKNRQDIRIPVKVTNHCADKTINVYYGQQNHLGTLAPQESLDTTTDTRGFFYIDEHGDSNDFSGVMRIGVSGNDYYFIVRDPNSLLTGASIAPTNQPATSSGFCTIASCAGSACANDSAAQMAFIYPPTRYPNPGSAPPSLPLHRCPGANDGEGYTITFCPN
jgi:hypothetical protein